MHFEQEARASFYKEVATVDPAHGVALVQHIETGKIYVRKTLTHYDRSVFDALKEARYHGIPAVHELIEDEGTLIVIEDYITGQNLEELLAGGSLSVRLATSVITQLCDILAPLHERKPPIIHRDIKASNVILDSKGDVFLIDYDASKEVAENKSRDTELIGTEEYAAPEQYGFRQSDQRTDIYALGVLLHKLLTGRFPSECAYKGPLSQVIKRATALDPKDRYSSVGMLKKAILQATGSRPAKEKSDSEESLLMRILYPFKQLPGIRSRRPLRVIAALAWYAFILFLSFFTKEGTPDGQAAPDTVTNIGLFLLLFGLTLYLGNYLGIRDRLPWKKTSSFIGEAFRISTGFFLLFVAVIIFMMIADAFLPL